MRIGVCYYPEHWDRDRVRSDAREMRDLGLEVVRIGEFAWSEIEPAPGVFSWDWFDEAVEILAAEGLKLIIGTPTATPPKWLIDAHPEILPWDIEGRPRKFGSRRHCCFSSPVYYSESERIVSAIVDRYGKHNAVIGWQTDNEYGCHDTVRSYSPASLAAFRKWLASRYGDVDKLNKAWGAVFWSQTYQSFNEVDLPNLTVTEPNPSHVLDFYRFSSDQVVAYNKMQTRIIRARSPGRDIYHNFMGFFTDFDHFKLSEDIDVAGWDSYPLGFLDIGPYKEEDKKNYMRQGHPDFAGFHHDLYRGCGHGRLAVLEQQPGPVNWARHNPAPHAGMVRLWTLESAAHGAELLCYFRWRQAPFAQEQMHAGLLRPDHSPADGYNEAKQAIEDLQTADALSVDAKTEKTGAKVALVFSYETQWMSEIQPQGAEWNYVKIAMQWYGAARAFGLDIDIVAPGTSLEGYAVVLVPSLFIVTQDAFAAFANSDATIIFGPRSGSKSSSMQIPNSLAPGPLQELIPVKVKHAESFPDFHKETGDFNDQEVTCGVWLDHMETALPAAVKSRNGAGLLYRNERCWLFAACPDDDFLKNLLADVFRERGISVLGLPDSLRMRSKNGLAFVFNYGTDGQHLANARAFNAIDDTISQGTIKPAGVAILAP